MGIVSRLSSIARAVQRGFSLPLGNSGWGGLGSWGGAPHEPFTGAWQRNLEQVAGAAPNLYANPGIYACVNVISSDIAILPIRIMQELPDGSRVEAIRHPATTLMYRPNPFQTQFQFIQHYMLSKLTSGNTYVLMLRDARGVVNEMYVLNPTRVQVLIADDGSLFYRLGRDLLNSVEGDITVPARDIIHDRTATIWHPVLGVSPLFAAGMPAMLASRMEMASEKFFANMSRAGGVLVSPGKIDPLVAKQLQTEWEKNYSQNGLGRTAVLSNGLDFKPMTVNAADSELVNQLRWTLEEIARVYRVPLYKIGELSKASFKNNEQMARSYFNEALASYIRAFEQCFDYALGLASDIYIEFDTDSMFRMEIDVRFTAYQTALMAGFMSINEVRRMEGRPPVPGGDEPRVQMQMVPLSQAEALLQAQLSAKKTPAAPAKNMDEVDEEPVAQLTLDFDSLVDAFVERLDIGEDNAR